MAKEKSLPPMPGPGGGRRGGPGRKPKNMGKTLSRLLGYLRPYKFRLAIIVVLVVFSAMGGVLGNYMLKPLINDYILPGDIPGLLRGLATLGCIYVLSAASSFGYSRLMLGISQTVMETLRRDLFNHMQNLPIRYFDRNTHGNLMSRYTGDMDTISEGLNMSVTMMVSSLLTVAGTFIMMLVLSPAMTLVTLAMLAVMLLVIRFVGSKSARYYGKQQKALGTLNGFIEETIEGQRVVKVFSHESKAMEGFAVHNDALQAAATSANTFSGILMPITMNLAYVTYALTAAFGGFIALSRGMDLGTLASFLLYTRSFSQPVSQMAQQSNVILSALAGAERIFEMMDEPAEEDDGKIKLVYAHTDESGTLVKSENRTGFWAWELIDGSLVELKGDVRFHNVTFGYDPGKVVLKDLSLYAKPGQKIAFVGSTGAGKTTITNLLNRFYDISEGTITYDGLDIMDIAKPSLRRSLGMVLQDTHLFSGTIMENIRYGRLKATDEEVVQAAKLANAHSFIKRLPDGYQTVLEGDGDNLSQGQRQLLSIARAAVAKHAVLVLDEATSSIDTRTERQIDKGMDQLMADSTVFVIAHRLSTVRNANAIMVLEQGQIIERGDHDELLEEKGRYYQLYTGQSQLT